MKDGRIAQGAERHDGGPAKRKERVDRQTERATVHADRDAGVAAAGTPWPRSAEEHHADEAMKAAIVALRSADDERLRGDGRSCRQTTSVKPIIGGDRRQGRGTSTLRSGRTKYRKMTPNATSRRRTYGCVAIITGTRCTR